MTIPTENTVHDVMWVIYSLVQKYYERSYGRTVVFNKVAGVYG